LDVTEDVMHDPNDLITLHARAVPVAQRVIDNIRPEQLGDPTPCTEWDVRALLNHLIGLNRMAAANATGDEMPAGDDDLVGDDPRTSFAEAARGAHTAFSAPGALERTFRMPWGEVPGAGLARVAFLDLVIHAWDLAKATGRPTTLDPELCETALAIGRTIMRDEYRRPGGAFGPEVAVPADAPACDRLAAFYGRRP
jgi:uncharacterized protein (TIGR03086 family)